LSVTFGSWSDGCENLLSSDALRNAKHCHTEVKEPPVTVSYGHVNDSDTSRLTGNISFLIIHTVNLFRSSY